MAINSPSLQQFVEGLVKEKGLTNLEKEILDQVKKDLLSRLEDRINAVILANIPPENLEFFEKMLDRSDEKEIQSFCQRNIADMDNLVAAELASFRKTYLGV
jgi:hypothetical protein